MYHKADLVKKIFDYERSFLVEASKCVQPSTVCKSFIKLNLNQNLLDIDLKDVLTKFYQLFTKFIEDIAVSLII